LKKVLIITYYWPPASGPGVQRWLKFAKYLPEYGWEPIILTVEGGSFPAMDEDLLQEVSTTTKVFRTKTWEPFGIYNRLRGKKGNQVEVGGGAFTADKSIVRRIGTYIRSNYFIPDARIGWNKSAIAKASALIQEYNITYIVTTSPPHSSQLIGLELKKKHKLKWLADLRDPWMSMMYNQFLTRTKASTQKDQKYENQILENADHVTVVGDSMKKEFSDRAHNITVITNGYDSDDLNHSETKQEAFEKFTLFFMGNFLSQQSFAFFWKTLKQFTHHDPEIANRFRMLIIGNVSEVVQKDIEHHNVTSFIDIEPFQSHDQVIRKMKRSHLLYLPIPKTEGNEMIITGKIFEYLASKLPILSIGPIGGDADYILRNTNRDKIISYGETDELLVQLQNAWSQWKSNKNQFYYDNDHHQQFERKSLTEKMSQVLNSL